MGLNRHFTVSVYIVNKDKVLLHKHKRAQILLPVGGHIETNELPEEAAIRESLEEAGIEVELYNLDSLKKHDVDTQREKILVKPAHMVWGEVEKGHEHIDLVFYGRSDSEKLSPGLNESNDLRWYSERQLESVKGELLRDVYLMAKEAIGVYKESRL